MGFDDICNTGLGLGIYRQLPQNGHIHHDQHQHQQQKMKKKQILKYDHLLPFLTLGPSEDHAMKSATKADDHIAGKVYGDQASSISALSSFSNSSSIKKEREAIGDEEDQELEYLERVSNSRVSDEDYEDQEGSPRKKLRLNKAQFATLEDSFKEHSTLTPKQKQALAERLNLRPRQVEVWFQNRRARTKLKQTEVDCELLKKCCETLTEENKRLQKELQELKSLKVAAAPLYMEMPAGAVTSLTMCPSCERICGGGGGGGGGSGDGSSTVHFSTLGPKPHFFNPFTHPSAASC
ncbi:hypothetical protein Dsin_003047 [Dipteronia sinensis]|uniref:Homeobox domain-containing protein n=1 Tax=Dipteronia sinensis TaxID=43782 RepID=A0AAE0B7C8_9ROSI|nr:hypothetical protein Dsin_003047 [Dipteronia sinensis]